MHNPKKKMSRGQANLGNLFVIVMVVGPKYQHQYNIV